MSGYAALARRHRIGDDFADETEASDAAEDAAFEDALEAEDQDGGGDPFGDAGSRWDDPANADPGGYDAGEAYSPYGQGGVQPPDASAGTPPSSGAGAAPEAPSAGAPSGGSASSDSADARIAILQQDVDDAEQAYYDAYQADLDALSDYWALQQDDSSTSAEIAAAAEGIKPLAAALPPLYDAIGKAQAALDAASKQGVTGIAFPSKQKTVSSSPTSNAVKQARDLHRKTAAVHAQSKALHTLVKASGRPMTPAAKAKAHDLRQQRRALGQQRRALRSALAVEAKSAKASSPPKIPPAASRTVMQSPAKPPMSTSKNVLPARRTPVAMATARSRIHGANMNGYTVLGETVGEGFDLGSVISSFTGGLLSGGRKDSGPSQAQQMQQMQMLQAQQEAQRAREAAAKARATAWTVGGVAAAGALAAVLWKALSQ